MFIYSASMWLMAGTVVGFFLGIILMQSKIRRLERWEKEKFHEPKSTRLRGGSEWIFYSMAMGCVIGFVYGFILGGMWL